MSKCNTYKYHSEKGFTLVEILVSLVIMLIMLMAFIPMFELIAKTIENNKSKQIATALANSVMEEMRTLPYLIKDPNTGRILDDPDIPQLGIQGGNPPGSIPATQTRVIDGKTYTIKTRVYWVAEGDNPIAYKKVKVSIESPSSFKGEVMVTSDFYTLAAQEGEAEVFNAGHIAIKIRNRNGVDWESPEIEININSDDNLINDYGYTEKGKALFGVIPAGDYTITAKLPAGLVTKPDQTVESGLIKKQNVTVTNTSTTEVYFDIDYPAKLSIAIKDDKTEVPITGNGELRLKWEDIALPSIPFTKANFADNKLSSAKIGNLWPEGKYTISLADVMDSETYKAYYPYNMAEEGSVKPKLNGADWDGSLGEPNSTTNISIDLKSALKTHLIADASMVETEDIEDEDGNLLQQVIKWEDQSGYGNDAVQYDEHDSPTPRPLWNNNYIAFNDEERLIIDYPVCVDNFAIFVVAKPTEEITLYTPSSTGVQGAEQSIYNNRYLFWPDHGGDSNAGQGISFGTNGICNFEHGSDYMPPTAVYTGSISSSEFTTLGIKYDDKKPYIYMNGSDSLIATGLKSPRNHVFSPTIIGGGTYGFFSGEVAAVMIYDLTLSDANMKLVSDYLTGKY